MKHIEFEANGYTFDASIDPDSPMGEMALNLSLSDLIKSFQNSAISLNLNPDNIEEMNAGGTQIRFAIVS